MAFEEVCILEDLDRFPVRNDLTTVEYHGAFAHLECVQEVVSDDELGDLELAKDGGQFPT